MNTALGFGIFVVVKIIEKEVKSSNCRATEETLNQCKLLAICHKLKG